MEIATGTINPSEFALSGYYSLKLSERFSMAVGLKYINSNLDVDNNSLEAVNSFAVDIGQLTTNQMKRIMALSTDDIPNWCKCS